MAGAIVSVDVAIVGSGPAGLSAAARAAERGLSHLLLEAEPRLSNTIFRYQRGKQVMAEPKSLPLRSPLSFADGIREAILDGWSARIAELGVQVRLDAAVQAITREGDDFRLTVAGGDQVLARKVVLAIGLQGNLNRLACPGAEHPALQYQLDDPDEYIGETIVVVGVGNAGLENALALTAQNRVVIVNEFDDFRFANSTNEGRIVAAIRDGSVVCHYSARVLRIEPGASAQTARLVLGVGHSEVVIDCDRIIARIGATPPRAFVERLGVVFPTPDRNALPTLSPQYESSVPGLYIVGALAGFPLIKQALNQGFDVIETIAGVNVEPVDQPMLRERLALLPGDDIDDRLDHLCRRLPLLAALTRLQLREFLLESAVLAPKPGTVVITRNDYDDRFYLIVDGAIESEHASGKRTRLNAGEFFGEMALLSGRRRAATVRAAEGCLLIETPRRTLLRLMAQVPGFRQPVESTFLRRMIQTSLAPQVALSSIQPLIESASVQRWQTGDCLFREGDAADCLHIISKGSVTVSRRIDGHDATLSYAPVGEFVGGLALLSETAQTVTAHAAAPGETIRIDGRTFKALLAAEPALRERLTDIYKARISANYAASQQHDRSPVVGFLMAQGLGEATDALLIDESLCTRCDQCEKACADTHGGVSRLKREAGARFGTLHVPTSCRHCESPHCMKDCPPDAIRRNPKGEVFITDACIGCGNCERNCPYGVIQMAEAAVERPSLWRWMMFGGREPGLPAKSPAKVAASANKKAVKCDMCMALSGGPACVRACPTGAAVRASPETFLRVSSLT